MGLSAALRWILARWNLKSPAWWGREGIFAALAQHDTNNDCVIDAKDAFWTILALWRDANHDGKSSPAEVTRLADHHIVAITLTGASASVSDAAGNASLRKISFRRADATRGSVYDVWFSVGFHKVPTDIRATGVASTKASTERCTSPSAHLSLRERNHHVDIAPP